MNGLLLVLTLSVPSALHVNVDGQPAELELLASFPGGEHVVQVDELTLWLDESHTWELTRVTTGGQSMLKEGDKTIAAKIDFTFEGETERLINPLAAVKDLSSLRGVLLRKWDPSVAATLARVKGAEHLCVEVDAYAATQKGLPPLPLDLPCLLVNPHASGELTDYSGLAALNRLRYASIDSIDRAELDGAWLSPRLEILSLTMVTFRHPEALSKLTALRALTIYSGSGIGGQLGALPAVTSLTIEHVKDMTSLASLVAPKLETLKISATPIAALPAKLPALARLRAMSTALAAPSVKAFAAAHPGAQLVTTWVDALKSAITGATRVRVRSGGLCHTNPEEEKTLFELAQPEDIAAFVGAIAIDESKSQGFCMCCGAPAFEFYKGKELLTSVGMQHGEAVRWEGWPADGTLADGRLVGLLAKRGVTGPLAEVERTRRQQAAQKAMIARYKQILPARVSQAIESGTPAGELAALLEAAVPDAAARTTLLLKVLGVRDGPWNRLGGLDQVASDALKAVDPKILGPALTTRDEEVLRGAQRLVFGGERAELAREPAVVALARRGVTSPMRENRWLTLVVLAGVESAGTTEVLRDVLRGKLVAPPPPPAAKADDGEGDDSDTFVARPDPLARWVDVQLGSDAGADVHDQLSERSVAALVLAKRKDAGSLEAMRALSKASKGVDAVAMRVALELLAPRP